MHFSKGVGYPTLLLSRLYLFDLLLGCKVGSAPSQTSSLAEFTAHRNSAQVWNNSYLRHHMKKIRIMPLALSHTGSNLVLTVKELFEFQVL